KKKKPKKNDYVEQSSSDSDISMPVPGDSDLDVSDDQIGAESDTVLVPSGHPSKY
ncbi:hypothetical protein QE152_g19755, partial [Popillia japonica]